MTIEVDDSRIISTGHIERQRGQWEALLGDIRQMDAELGRHQAERAQIDAALDAATLDSDVLELAAKKIRRDLLAKEISRLERAIFRARQEEEQLSSIVSQYEGKLTMACMGDRQRSAHDWPAPAAAPWPGDWRSAAQG